MKRQNLSRLAMAAVACLSIVAVAYLFPSLHGAQATMPQQAAATEGKETPIDITPKAPPISPEDIKAYTPTPEQSAEERLIQLRKDIKEQRKAARAAAVAIGAIEGAQEELKNVAQEKKSEKSEEIKESKEEKKLVSTTAPTTTAPLTRNLVMIFDDGHDNGLMLTALATSFLQQCAFIIINQQLWQLFITASAKTIFTEENASDDNEQALQKALDNKSCADIFFVPSEWDVYATEGEDAQLNKQDTLYLFVPHQYKKMLLDSTSKEDALAKAAGQKTPVLTDDERLGLKLSRLALLKNPTSIAASKMEAIMKPYISAGTNNYREGTIIANALAKVLLPYKNPLEQQSSVELLDTTTNALKKANTVLKQLTIKIAPLATEEQRINKTLTDAEKRAAAKKELDEIREQLDVIHKKKETLERQKKHLTTYQHGLDLREQILKIRTSGPQVQSPQATTNHSSYHSWNIYLNGHGLKGNRDMGQIAGIAIPAFENIIKFFDRKVHTNFFFYSTCFGGGEHLTTPFAIKGVPVSLHYPIAAGSLLDAPSLGSVGRLSTLDLEFRKNVFAMANLTKTSGFAVHFGSTINFETFFNGLESFATGKSTNTDLIHTLNAVAEFLTPDLKEVSTLENTPHIRFPGSQWFMVMRLAQELPLIHLTRAKIMAKNYDALHHNKPWKFDVTGNTVLLQSHDIALPLIVDRETELIPLVHAVPFLQQKSLILDNKTMPNLFAFTAPLIAKGGLFDILSCLWFLHHEIELTDIALIIDTLICGNDLDTSQQKTLSTTTALKLEHVMIFLNTPSPLNLLTDNAVLFSYNNNYYLLDMDKLTDQLSHIDDETAKQYQTIYKQCKKFCVDERMEPLRAANEKTFVKKLVSAALASIESMKSAIEAERDERLKNAKKELAAVQEQLEMAKNDFLSTQYDDQEEALRSFKKILETNTKLAIPTIIETASRAFISPEHWLAAELFQILLEKNKGVSVCIKTAFAGIKSTDEQIQANAIALFTALVENRHVFPEAIKVASSFMQSTDDDVQRNALYLFKALFEEGQGFNEAIKTASSCIKSTNDSVRRDALDLFKALVEKGQGFNEAINAASSCIESTNDSVRCDALALFKALVEKGQGSNEAIKLASSCIESTDWITQSRALDLFKALVEKGQGFNEALESASSCMQSTDDYVRRNALDLFKALVEKGQGFNEALESASSYMQSTDNDDLRNVLDLFKALVEKGQGLDEATNAASTGMCIITYYFLIQSYALQLFKALFAKKQGFAEAQAVIDLINNNDTLIAARGGAKALQEALDQAQPEAQKTATAKANAEQKAEGKDAEKSVAKKKAETQPSQPQAPTAASWVCPGCGAQTTTASWVCPACGSWVCPACCVKTTAASWICPECGAETKGPDAKRRRVYTE